MFSIIGTVCVGDETSCGGRVATGSPSTDIDGRLVARVGDRISCRYNCVITTGSPTDMIDGAQMAIHGSQTSRRCVCISKHNNHSGVSSGGGSTSGAGPLAQAADAAIAAMPDTAALLNDDQWVEFKLTNDHDEPLPNQPYLVTDSAGKTYSGRLDSAGYAKVAPVKAGTCKVAFPELGYVASVETCQQ
jgi:uncharacterized Zn-binding protein involved in type VI secretion